MRFDIACLFPDVCRGYLSQSLVRQALVHGLMDVRLHNLRDWARDRHRTVDDRPFGGGPGMVIKVQPVVECVEDVQRQAAEPGRLIMLTPRGQRLTQPVVESLAASKRLLLMCGRYEGFDERVSDILRPEEISVGDFVLGGGEVAALVLIDAVARLIPGVLGDPDSPKNDSFSNTGRVLEHAQYTRPREYRGHRVPDILLSGDHPAIERWRRQQSLKTTRQRRSDLLAPVPNSNDTAVADRPSCRPDAPCQTERIEEP